MLYLIIIIVFTVIFVGPNLWVKYILKKYERELPGMPGTGGELANHLVNKYELDGTWVKRLESDNDHYDPQENSVNLSPRAFDGKSLTAIAIAAHEVGHAIQFSKKEPVSFLRRKYLPKAILVKQIGIVILMGFPIIAVIVKVPYLIVLQLLIGVVTMTMSVLMYVAILPEEFDASFNKALPLLEEGEYVPEVYLPAIKKILKACALTYVASALADILRLWRWIKFFR